MAVTKKTPNPVFFTTQLAFRKWLEENYQTQTELIVGYYKVNSGKPSMTWSESVDQALCFGWIDSIRRSIDEESYSIRFSPRKPTSNWSKVNIDKMERLIAAGLVLQEGLDTYEKRKEHKSAIYSYENRPKELSFELASIFKQNDSAWKFFTTQAPSYQKMMIYWVMSAKRSTTQHSRLEKLIKASQQQTRLR